MAAVYSLLRLSAAVPAAAVGGMRRFSGKNTKNLRNNGRIRVKFDKWLVHIPFLCHLTILLISAEGAVYGGY